MDLYLQDNGDGGELILEGGDVKGDGTFFTPVYVSLFGGDSFSNVYEKYKTNGEFEEALNQPITNKNLKNVENKAKKALEWMIEEGVAEAVEVSAFGDIQEKINVKITIQEPSGNDFPFAVTWENEKAVLRAI